MSREVSYIPTTNRGAQNTPWGWLLQAGRTIMPGHIGWAYLKNTSCNQGCSVFKRIHTILFFLEGHIRLSVDSVRVLENDVIHPVGRVSRGNRNHLKTT